MNSLRDKFVEFHRANPHVFQYYMRFARELKAAGQRTLSISLITERIRWEVAITTASDDGFKINNNHRAFYARLLGAMPEFAGMFRTREQKEE